MSFGLHAFLPHPSIYLSVLRKPLSRIASYYRYARSSQSMHLHKQVVERDLSLEEFVCSDISHQLDNLQTRMLSGMGYSVGFGQCTAEMLEAAKRNIEVHFVVTGLVERYDETLLLLKNRLGWKDILYYRVNTTDNNLRGAEITEAAAVCIQERNELDIALYEWVSARFAEDVAAQGPGFQRQLALYRLLNRAYGSLIHIYRRWRGIREQRQGVA
jgi:hypothetical protein